MSIFLVTVSLGHETLYDDSDFVVGHKKVEGVEEVTADAAWLRAESAGCLWFTKNDGTCIAGYGPGEWVKFKVKE